MSIPDKIPQLSASTSNYVSLVTDPYHDYNLRATGYPDGQVLFSSIKRQYGRITISCPFVLATDDTWDFHVFTTPLHYLTDMTGATHSGNVFTASVTPATLGPITVFYKHYLPNGTITDSKLVAMGEVVVSNTPQNSSQNRTVSLGFELHNTTAELYKSGSLTVYRTPVIDNNVDGYMTLLATTSPHSTTVIASIPISLDEANMLPNSRTWEASHGAYCIGLPALDNRLSPYLPTNVCIKGGILESAYNMVNVTSSTTPTLVRYASYSPMACAGVISSRFKDSNQIFALDYRQVLEEVPNASAKAKLSYASTAPEVDRAFLKIYKNMFNRIPPGTYVSNNASGDWFRSIIRIVRDTLPHLTPFLPGQAKVIASTVLPIVNQVLDNTILKKPNTTQRLVTAKTLKKALIKKKKPKMNRK